MVQHFTVAFRAQVRDPLGSSGIVLLPGLGILATQSEKFPQELEFPLFDLDQVGFANVP